jgi:DASS family divalent anion:Na+ symporter
MNKPTFASSKGAEPGIRIKPALATLIIGLALFLGLPRLAPVPAPGHFKGMAGSAALAVAPASAGAASPAAGVKPALLVETKAQAAAEARRRADWEKSLHLLAIFITTIVGIILKPLPMGAVAALGIALTAVSGTLAIGDALSGFSDVVIWLIVLAFFISRGFIKTGLGSRIAYNFMALLGRRTLGLSYGLAATDLVLAPAIPSNTARAGGIVMPIMASLARAYGSMPGDGTERKIGSFLTITAYQVNVITSAMFLTAMAANPLAQKLAGELKINITWGGWALAAIVPGLLSLILVPWVIYKLYPPEVKETPGAVALAKQKLAELGPVSVKEWMMLFVFAMLLVLWIFARQFGDMNATTAALLGLGALLVLGVLGWEDVKAETGAWDTLVWFAALVMMASYLNKLGMIPWFSQTVGGMMAGHGWIFAFLVLSLTYFYSHYFFASNTAHVASMYGAFLGVSVALGAPPLLAALVLGFFSNLFAGMTHYGAGPAPVLFGTGYVEIGAWWRIGFLVSLLNIVIWLGLGGLWWKALGLW